VSITNQITREIHKNGIAYNKQIDHTDGSQKKIQKPVIWFSVWDRKKLRLQRPCLASYGLDNLQDYTDHNEQSRHIIGSSYVDWNTQHESSFRQKCNIISKHDIVMCTHRNQTFIGLLASSQDSKFHKIQNFKFQFSFFGFYV